MAQQIQVKLVEISEQLISIQDAEATLYEHLVTIDAERLARYRQIQRDFDRMQNELLELIEKAV